MPQMPQSKFDPQKHHRRSIRLKGYDYSSEGAYYVTIVTQGRECLFGEIIDREIHINEYGKIVQKWWNEIPIHFPNVELGAFVIMPNHVHGIIFITTERRGEVISPHDNPNNNIQDTHLDETNNLGGETPTQTDIGANRCVFQISIYQRDEPNRNRKCDHEILAEKLIRTYNS
jgi:hypothetical protein